MRNCSNGDFCLGEMTKAFILDLGCGRSKHIGSIGVDNAQVLDVDVICDLSFPQYPFKDSSIEKIHCCHLLEHFDSATRLRALDEIHRLLRNGGILHLSVPHIHSVGFIQDPTHKCFFSYQTMNYFDKRSEFHYYSDLKSSFRIVDKSTKVDIGYTRIGRTSTFKLLNVLLSKIMTWIFRKSDTLADAIVKFLPFLYVEINWMLEKD